MSLPPNGGCFIGSSKLKKKRAENLPSFCRRIEQSLQNSYLNANSMTRGLVSKPLYTPNELEEMSVVIVCTSNRFRFGTLNTCQRKSKLWPSKGIFQRLLSARSRPAYPGPRIVLRLPLSPGRSCRNGPTPRPKGSCG